MKKIFFLEDDISLISGLNFALKKRGYEVTNARTIMEAKSLWEKGRYDIDILDVSLPDGMGYEICKWIREQSNEPILFLTAADEEMDITMGLDLGGDDYITKPFKLAVFLSRIHALLRRSNCYNQDDTSLCSNNMKVERLKGEVYQNGKQIELTAGEYKLLVLFMQNPNIVLSSEQILSNLWDSNENFIDTNSLTVYIRRLRTKIEEDPGHPTKIVTVRGMGYKWNTASGM